MVDDEESRPRDEGRAAIERLCAPVLAADEFELVDVEWKRSRRQPEIRLYVHRPGGVTIGECQKILRTLEPILQVEGILDDRTVFEVASPGLDRPLHSAADFRRAEGHFVTVRRRVRNMPQPERLVGKVIGVTEDAITLLLDSNETAVVPLNEIEEGRFEIRF